METRTGGSSLALLTDLYQLTMAYAYWKSGMADREAVFQLSFRSNPFDGGFSLACGLVAVIEFLEQLRFEADDLDYLSGLRAADGRALFEPAFLDRLAALRFACDLDAVPEGTPVFPLEPVVRVRGPLLQAQLLETPLLNLVNFQTLIATKAARVCLAAGDQPVLEFGLRRAQGVDGGLSASRAAYLGGVAATSNVLAGKRWGIPVRGTHAHSWVMAFGDEREAFEEFARALPSSCILLVDTYDSLRGVDHAIEVGRRLRERGHELQGIRLDSGDLAALSREARRRLDEAGFGDAVIVASSDLDEHRIAALKARGAAVGIWGVGTRLATGYDQPAMNGVYKLAAVRVPGEPWSHRVKRSEEHAKGSLPGVLQVRRFRDGVRLRGDLIYDEERGVGSGSAAVPLEAPERLVELPPADDARELLVPVYREGKRVYEPPTLEEARRSAREELERLPAGVTRLVRPDRYPVSVEASVIALQQSLWSRGGRARGGSLA